MIVHNLGYPRIGAQRELKWAVERYWQGKDTREQLEQTGRQLREQHWAIQRRYTDLVPVGDFSWYDQVLDMSCLLGVIPPRFGSIEPNTELDTYFRMARGRAPRGPDAAACAMKKWFDSNYHYIVPEFQADQSFAIISTKLFNEVNEALALGHRVKPVLLGPLSYLWLGKCADTTTNKLSLLEKLLPAYNEILVRLKNLGIEWVQIDEPILVLTLTPDWQRAFEFAYNQLAKANVKLLLASYFGGLGENLNLTCHLPVNGVHVDLVRAPEQLIPVIDQLPSYKILSAGLIDGRNVWATDLDAALAKIKWIENYIGSSRLWLAPSCSLLHVPVRLAAENQLPDNLVTWMAFADEKLEELALLKSALEQGGEAVSERLNTNRTALQTRKTSPLVHSSRVKDRVKTILDTPLQRTAEYEQRIVIQQQQLKLPILPTTTIGSFPQTDQLRKYRRQFKRRELSSDQYDELIRAEIKHAIVIQEQLGLDVLVHGEAERTDMVEFFGEQLQGFAITQYGWVQSYGSRCVKPPILFGDVQRKQPMTVDYARYAQSLTEKPVKGMLTGPITILQWSFVRDDQSREQTCKQIAVALRDEVIDLEAAGIGIIQVDEPALREGLPLATSKQQAYLEWATQCFRIATTGVKNETQIHTHMCYSEFNDIIDWIAKLDADVITIETARSHMSLLRAFQEYRYPNAIGPGTYDVHSPQTPSIADMTQLLSVALQYLPAQQLWVNPDCGLKTRQWPEVEAALRNMVAAAKQLRVRLATSEHINHMATGS